MGNVIDSVASNQDLRRSAVITAPNSSCEPQRKTLWHRGRDDNNEVYMYNLIPETIIVKWKCLLKYSLKVVIV